MDTRFPHSSTQNGQASSDIINEGNPATLSVKSPDSIPVQPTNLLLNLFKSHLLIIWQAVLFFGGVILAFHFAYIAYFPDLDLPSSVALLALVSLTGLIIAVFIAFLLIFPLFIWQTFVEETGPGERIADELRKRKQPGNIVILWELGILFALPIALILVILLCILVYSNVASDDFSRSIWIIGLTVFIGGSAYLAFNKIIKFPKPNKSEIGIYLLFLFISLIVFVPSPLLIYAFFNSKYSFPDQQLSPNVLTITATVLALFINTTQFISFVSSSKKTLSREISEQISIGLAIFLMVIVFSKSWSLIPQGIIRSYNLGDIDNTSIVFNKDGCSVLRQLDVKYLSVKDNDTCTLSHSSILSRIGATYYIATDTGKRLPIPKSLILSYARETPIPAHVKISETVEAESNLKNSKITLTNKSRDTFYNISIILESRDDEGITYERKVIVKDLLPAGCTLYFDYSPKEQHNGGWCNIVLLLNNKEVSYKLERLPAVE